MVPPRAPSFAAGHGSRRGWPPAGRSPASAGHRSVGGVAPILGACCARFSSTSTSRCRGPGPSSGRRRTGASAPHTGSTSTPSGTRTRGWRRSPTCRAHPELVHDEEIWISVHRGHRPGDGRRRRRRPCLRDRHGAALGGCTRNFDLYDDALPALAALRRQGLRIGLISNGQRDLEEFAGHHGLDVDVAVGSKSHGRTKPHASIFETALAALGVTAAETVMVGDSYADDIEGARALGIRAILLDRDEQYPCRAGPDRRPEAPGLRLALAVFWAGID